MINHAFKSNYFPCYPQKIAVTTRLVGNYFSFYLQTSFFHKLLGLLI